MYGTLPTFVLLPSVVKAVEPVPVLAAGGISTGRQLAAALMLGAEGVWVGTRCVASTEAFAHPEYKRRLLELDGTQTRLTSIYGPDMAHFNPMRVLDLGLAHEFAGREEKAPKDLESQPVIGKMNLAGQGVGLIHQVLPVKEILEGMITEAISALSGLRVENGS